MAELQPGESLGFLRPCGKDITNQNSLYIENCPSDWTDHTTAQICKGYALYSRFEVNVSNKIILLPNPLRQHYTAVMNVRHKQYY
jgi:hypothetical protein